MLEIDGSRFSGSGTIVRQAVALAALTGRAARIVNARVRRPRPGLRPQHVRAVEAVRQLVSGTTEGVAEGSRELVFHPGGRPAGREFTWDIGSAGSTVLLALAVLPVVAFAPEPVRLELRGGLFQDFAPSYYHLCHVLLPLVRAMGIDAEVEMGRPGYVPRGDGILFLTARPASRPLLPLLLDEAGPVQRVWGVALSSHLQDRDVSRRMAQAAAEAFLSAGHRAELELVNDASALQPGAALAAFADLAGGARLGADRAGAPRRRAEGIGRYVAGQLLDDLAAGATLDRHAADQVIPFAALAQGESRFRVPRLTGHMEAGAWLVRKFLDAEVRIQDREMVIRGTGLTDPPAAG